MEVMNFAEDMMMNEILAFGGRTRRKTLVN